jgi:hypothetical protein
MALGPGRLLVLALSIVLAVVPGMPSVARGLEPAPQSARRHVGITPGATLEAQTERALRATNDADRMAALSVIAALADRTSEGAAQSAARTIADALSPSSSVRGDALALARAHAADEGTPAGVAHARADAGIVTELSILGPFRDTGGGLERRDGPEAQDSAAAFTDAATSYAWGTVDVRWRTVPNTFAQARGVPLDLFLAPRKESCAWIASKITLDRPSVLIVRLASTGTARLTFDGADLATSEDVHERMHFDRLAAKVDAGSGPHLLAAKLCSGALPDAGRVRLRITDEENRPVAIEASSNLALTPSETLPWRKVKASPVITPLIGAASGKGTPQALLNAAITRTLGGADDQKSPRAPGQLDALLQAPSLDVDTLAMAAWITPTGANRSARLYRAKQAAERANDARVRSFVERRLLDQQIDSETPDWAIASLRGSRIHEAADDEALLFSARIARALRVDSLQVRAMRALKEALSKRRATLPLALLLELTITARNIDVPTWVDATLELARRGIRGEVLVDAMSTRTKQDVESAANDAFTGGMDDADEALAVANHVAQSGNEVLARKLYETLTHWAPNRAEAWSGLARAIYATATDEASRAKALRSLRRARELSPGDAKVRAELSLRRPPARPDASAHEEHEDERYLVASDTLLARRKGIPQGTPDVADRQLHWLRAVRTHADGRVSQLIHYAREIVIAPRNEQELFEALPSEGDLTEILRARVHRKSGGIAFPVEEHNDGARPRIRWPDLEQGDTVEVAVRQWTSHAVGGRGDSPFYFVDYAGSFASHPLLYNEVIVETVPSRPLYVDILNESNAQYTKTESDDRARGVHVLRLVTEKPVMVPEEPLAPHLSETAPVIVGSTFKTWSDFRAWYAEAIRGFTEPDDEVRRLAAELTKGKTTRDAKLKALFEFVADDIRYVNYISGEWWLPNRPQQLLARREGDCDDKAILLMTLLRAVGIEAQEVMVQTRLTAQKGLLSAKNAAVPLFDHGIAFLPGPNGGMYLDATSPQSRLGPLPSMDARAAALRMDSGPAEIVELPTSSPRDHGSDVRWQIMLAKDGAGELSGEETHSGDGAFWLRTNLSQAEARAQYVEDALVGPWFSTIQLDKNIAFEGNLAEGHAVVRYKARARAMARREGSELVLSLSPSSTMTAQLAPLRTRTLPVELPPYLAPSHQDRTLRVTAPAGMSWGPLPPGGQAQGGEFGRAQLDITREGRVLSIKRSVIFDQHRIPVSKYAAWRAWLESVDALMHKEVRLVEATK